MVIGYPPFYSENSKDTCKKIMQWKKYLKFPTNVKVSDEVKDLMTNLINDVDKRLGYNGADEIKRHPWFKGIDWNNLKSMKPPFVPDVKSDYDTKNFEIFKEKPDRPFLNADRKGRNINNDICFLDFSFQKETPPIALLDIFEQIQEEKKLKQRDKSTDVKHSQLSNLNVHTNFQSNITAVTDNSEGSNSLNKTQINLKDLNKKKSVGVNTSQNKTPKISALKEITEKTINSGSSKNILPPRDISSESKKTNLTNITNISNNNSNNLNLKTNYSKFAVPTNNNEFLADNSTIYSKQIVQLNTINLIPSSVSNTQLQKVEKPSVKNTFNISIANTSSPKEKKELPVLKSNYNSNKEINTKSKDGSENDLKKNNVSQTKIKNTINVQNSPTISVSVADKSIGKINDSNSQNKSKVNLISSKSNNNINTTNSNISGTNIVTTDPNKKTSNTILLSSKVKTFKISPTATTNNINKNNLGIQMMSSNSNQNLLYNSNSPTTPNNSNFNANSTRYNNPYSISQSPKIQSKFFI